MTVWEDRPQTYAVLSDGFIFLTAGMNLALSLGYNYYFVSTHFQFSWFIGVIIGVLLSAPFIQIFIKRYFALLSSCLVVIAGVVYIAWPHDPVALLATRYLNGIATGLITVPFIVHCSEISVLRKRGFCLGLEQLCTAVGIFIQVTYIVCWESAGDFSAQRLHGIICLGCGLIAFGLAFIVIESPVLLIRRAEDAAALDSLTRLQLPTVLSDEKKDLLEEHKNYVATNELLGTGGSLARGLGPFIRMVLYRGVLPFTFSLPHNRLLQLSTFYGITTGTQWTSIVSTVLRVLGVLTALSMMDVISRKIASLIGLLVMGGFVIGVAVIFAYVSNWYEEYEMSMACVILMIFQYFAGLYAPTSTVYLGEAFPMLLKPYFIALCVCVECVIHIIIICTFDMTLDAVYGFNTFTYVYLFACFLLFLFTMPDTRLTTLIEAQKRLCSWNNLRSW